jgi:hypothetical protein
MRRAGAGRAALVGSLAGALVLAGAQTAAADRFQRWSGQSRPFAWEARRLSCGVADEQPGRVRAHSRWRTSPANGYQRVTFKRQFRGEGSGRWTTVQRARLSTRDGKLEGTRGVLHWRMSLPTFGGHAGKRSRYVVNFVWLRDRPRRDRLVFTRRVTLRPCVVGG